MSNFLVELFGREFFPTPPILDRAHRIGPLPTSDTNNTPSGRPKPKGPRMFIVRFHYYSDKDRVLRRRGDPLKFQGKDIHIFPDHTTKVAKMRAEFIDIKSSLYERNIKFSLLFPARLRVDYPDGRKFFDDSEIAQTDFNRRYTQLNPVQEEEGEEEEDAEKL